MTDMDSANQRPPSSSRGKKAGPKGKRGVGGGAWRCVRQLFVCFLFSPHISPFLWPETVPPWTGIKMATSSQSHMTKMVRQLMKWPVREIRP